MKSSISAADAPHGSVRPEESGRARSIFRLGVAMALPLMLLAQSALAGEIGTDEKYIETVKKASDITPLAMDSFGDRIDLAEGAGSFQWTDIDIPGNNALPVRLQRQLTIEDKDRGPGDLGGFGMAGSLDIPYLKGIHSSQGWQVNGATPNARCSQFAQGARNYTAISARDYWSGNQLHIPWEGTQQMLSNPDASLPRLAGSAAIMTKNFWSFNCLEQTKNGVPGEAFVAVSPRGERYYFDWVVARDYATLRKQYGTYGATATLERDAVYFLVSRIEDRFGNWVTYNYVGDKLQEIRSSDGRFIHVDSWNGSNIASVSSSIGSRTYAYTPTSMAMVLPDGSNWTYASTGALKTETIPMMTAYDPSPRCPAGDPAYGTYGLVVTQPSGASATFQFEVQRHRISNVPETCNVFSDGKYWTVKFLSLPNFHDTFTLQSKTVQGVGVAPMTWTYSYSGGGGLRSFYADCQDPNRTEFTCPGKSLTVVRGPDRSYKKYVFGTMFDENMGQLLSSSEGYETGVSPDVQTVILKTVVNTYLTNDELDAQPFPSVVGGWGSSYIDRSTSALVRPLRETTTTQQGATFTKRITAFDSLARPTASLNSSSLGFSRTGATEYSDNYSLWVLGQVKKEWLAGIEVARTDFYATNALPWKTYKFTKLEQTLTYNADGTIATVSDGRDGVAGAETTVSLSSWKRGIPQSIRYPATPDSPTGGLDSAVVNDDGTIASVTQETGAKTCYTYDLVGRLTSITYPSELANEAGLCNSNSWRATTRSFGPSATADYGLAAGHWKQTVATGMGTKITHFDALLRPVVEESYDATNASTTAGTRSITVKRYDASGRLAFQSYPIGSLGQYTDTALLGASTSYDALDRPVRVAQNSELGYDLVTTTSYLEPFTSRVKTPRGDATTTTVSYMAFDQPTTEWPINFALPAGAFTDIARDSLGKPKSMTRRNADSSVALTRSYVYDPVYQTLCKVIEPETGATIQDYDKAGNLAWTASGLNYPSTNSCNTSEGFNSGRRSNRTYDARNRLLALDFPDGRGNLEYVYFPDGSVSSVSAENDGVGANVVTTNYDYYRRGLIKRETMKFGASIDWPIDYAYNGNGHLLSSKYNGLLVDYAPNSLGQPTRAGTFATGVSYYPNGGIKQFTYGNGIVHTMVQNERQLPEVSTDSYVNGSGATIRVIEDSYDYDNNGNVVGITDSATGTSARGNRTMTYDAMDRLTRAQSIMFGTTTSHAAAYAYDALDNLKRVTINSTAEVPGRDNYYCYDGAWRLTNVKTTSCSGATVIGLAYDEQGNLENKNGQVFDFDYGNRLRKVQETVNGTLTTKMAYLYDGSGRRIRDLSSASKYSQYSQSGQLVQVIDNRAGVVYEYVYLGGSLVAIRERTGTSGSYVYAIKYQHTDALGSPVAVTDSGKTVVERNEYEPYGKVMSTLAKDGPGFTGHVLDAATGLNYMQQRYYDPGIGRFLSVDPVSPDGATGKNFNRYWYANNNPYKFTDPDGRLVVPAGDVEQVNKDLELMKAEPEGLAFYNRLNDSPFINIVAYGSFPDPATTDPTAPGFTPGPEGQPGSGAGGIVRIDPSQPIFEKGPDGNPVEIPGFVKLAHELGHVDAMNRGVQSTDKGSGLWGTTPPSEEQSMQSENAVRGEHGIQQRDTYYREPVEQPPTR